MAIPINFHIQKQLLKLGTLPTLEFLDKLGLTIQQYNIWAKARKIDEKSLCVDSITATSTATSRSINTSRRSVSARSTTASSLSGESFHINTSSSKYLSTSQQAGNLPQISPRHLFPSSLPALYSPNLRHSLNSHSPEADYKKNQLASIISFKSWNLLFYYIYKGVDQEEKDHDKAKGIWLRFRAAIVILWASKDKEALEKEKLAAKKLQSRDRRKKRWQEGYALVGKWEQTSLCDPLASESLRHTRSGRPRPFHDEDQYRKDLRQRGASKLANRKIKGRQI